MNKNSELFVVLSIYYYLCYRLKSRKNVTSNK